MSIKITRKQAKKLGITQSEPKHMLDRPSKVTGRNRLFDEACRKHDLPIPEHEYCWGEEVGRKWRSDWCFSGHILVEQVGGVWVRGHHSRGQDQIDDMARRNSAQILGYLVLEFTPQQIESGEAFPVIKAALGMS